jgi:hypothetical protein
MADANEVQPYNYPADSRTDFDRLGHPGKFYSSITCTTGTTNFTGSNFGVGAIMVMPGTVGTASLSRGGAIPLSAFTASNAMFEISVSSIKVDSGGPVYALIRNQIIR